MKRTFLSTTGALLALSLAFAPALPDTPPEQDAPPTDALSATDDPATDTLADLGVVEPTEPEPLGPEPSPAPPVPVETEQAVLAATAEAAAAQVAAQRAEEKAAAEAQRQAEVEAAEAAKAEQEGIEAAAENDEPETGSTVELAAETPAPQSAQSVWDDLADCESGEWDANANPIPGSARWDYGAPGAFSRPGYDFDGGLNFHPDTWSWAAPMVGLGHIDFAYNASRGEQITVGEKVQELQGWRAWPVCSRKVGLR